MTPALTWMLLVLPVRGTLDDPVDPALVGRWRTEIRNEHGTWTLTLTLEASGACRTTIQGPASVPEQTGTMRASKGSWSLKRPSGEADGGTYVLTGDTWTVTGKAGTVTWKRLAEPPAAPPATAAVGPPSGRPASETAPDDLSWLYSGTRFEPPPPIPAGAAEYVAGLEALEAPDFDAAVGAFDRALTANSENWAYLRGRGFAHFAAGRYREARDDFQRAFRLSGGRDRESCELAILTAKMAPEIGGSGVTDQGTPLQGVEYIDALGPMVAVFQRNAHLIKSFSNRGSQKASPRALPPSSPQSGGMADRYIQERVGLEEWRKQCMPKIATLFAARQMAEPALGGFLYKKVQSLIRENQHARAAVLVDRLLRGAPDDTMLLQYKAGILISLGDAQQGRALLTRVLTGWTDHGRSYLLRAQACARTGALARARKDLELARRYSPQEAAEHGKIVEDEIRKAEGVVPKKAPGELARAFIHAAESGEAAGPLAERACALYLARENARVDALETFQDQVRELQDGIRANPRNPNATDLYAQFLLLKGYRDRAAVATDRTLALDPNHADGLLTKTLILIERLQLADARQVLEYARRRPGAGERPRFLYVEATLLAVEAADKRVRALRLEATQTWEDANYIYTRYPSEAELALAQKLKAEAEADDARAAELVARANTIKSRQGRSPLESFLDRAPTATDASPFIRASHEAFERTAYDTARLAIERALDIDAVDLEAYKLRLGLALAEKNDAAAMSACAAIEALEEARARLQGRSLAVSAQGPLPQELAILTLACRNRRGALLLTAGKWEQALSFFEDTLKIEARVLRTTGEAPATTSLPTNRPKKATPVSRATAPEPGTGIETEVVMVAESVDKAGADAHNCKAFAMLSLGRTEDAAREIVTICRNRGLQLVIATNQPLRGGGRPGLERAQQFLSQMALRVYQQLGPEKTASIFGRNVVQAFADLQRHAAHQAAQANPEEFHLEMSEFVEERQKPVANRLAQVERELADVVARRQTPAGRSDPALSAQKMRLETEKATLSSELVRIRMEAERDWRVKAGLEAPPPAPKVPDDPNVKRAARGDPSRK